MPTVLITGANRGLGLEFVRQYAADGWQVIACARFPSEADELRTIKGSIIVHPLDVSDFGTVDALAGRLEGTAVDVLLNNAGVIGPRTADNDLGQSFGHINYAAWADVLRVNTMAPLKMAEAFVENVAASAQKKIVTISSTIGSHARAEGGVYAYRTSKTAVNMVMHNLAADLKPRDIITAAFCPGWVKTRMGGSGAQIEPPVSIAGVRRVIDGLTLETSGRFWLYDGSALSW